MKAPVDDTLIQSKLNWFQIESKLRRIVLEIIKPVILRAHEDREQIFSTWDYAKKSSARIDTIDSYLFKNIDDADLRKRSKIKFEDDEDAPETGVQDLRSKPTRGRATKIDELEMRFDMIKS